MMQTGVLSTRFSMRPITPFLPLQPSHMVHWQNYLRSRRTRLEIIWFVFLFTIAYITAHTNIGVGILNVAISRCVSQDSSRVCLEMR